MALQVYTPASVFVNGALLTEESSVTVDVSSNASPVTTVAKGFAGMAVGAPTISLKIDNAVPAAGFELNPGSFLLGLKVVEFSIFAANAQLTIKGFVTDYTFSHAVNQESRLSLTAMCEPGSFT